MTQPLQKKKVKFLHTVTLQLYNHKKSGLGDNTPVNIPLSIVPKIGVQSATFIRQRLYTLLCSTIPWNKYKIGNYKGINKLFKNNLDILIYDLWNAYNILSKGNSFILNFRKCLTLSPFIPEMMHNGGAWVKTGRKIKVSSRLCLYLVNVLCVQGYILRQLQSDAAVVIQATWRKKQKFLKKIKKIII